MNDGLLLVDKPAGITSHGVVAVARRALGTRGIGHAGTLDPMATGLLVLAVGEARKVLRYLSLDDKRYTATVSLGAETDSLDADGRVTREAAVPADLSVQQVATALANFVGEIEQTAPRVSAIKQGGVPLHARVRRGEVVEAPVRRVLVHALELLALRPDGQRVEIELNVHCGKGFYVRALARDLALALGTLGHLSALRRTHSGPFELAEAVPLALLRGAAQDATLRAGVAAHLLGLERALPHAPRLVLEDQGVEHARCGRAIPLEQAPGASGLSPGAEPVLLCDGRGAPVAIGRVEEECLRVTRGFNWSS